MTRLVEGDVDRLRCHSCGAIISKGGCSGDNDMVVFGLICFASLTADEVVIAEAEGNEFEGGFEATVSAVLQRVSMALGRNDLYFVPLLRTEERVRKGPPRFRGFFPVEYDSPKLFYRCPHCGGEATIERTETFAEFQREGGQIRIVGDIKLTV